MAVPEFKYNGLSVYELPSVTKIDGQEQLNEIDRRIKALYDFSRENSLIMTPVHIRNVLAVSEATYIRYKHGKLGNAELALQDQTKQEFVKARSALVKRWESIADGYCMDKVSGDTVPARSIFMAKAIFGHWDSPAAEKELAAQSIEVIIKQKGIREAKASGKAPSS